MTNERRGTRRPADRPAGGGGHGDFRPYRPRRTGGAPDDGERSFGGRGGGERSFGGRGGSERSFGGPSGGRGGGYAGRGADEGGMSVRVDPRRLSLLKELSAAEGLRPGQLVQRWIEERLDAERGGGATAGDASRTAPVASLESALSALSGRVDALAQRLGRLETSRSEAPATPPVTQATAAPAAATAAPAAEAPTTEPVTAAVPAAPRRRGRPPKRAAADGAATTSKAATTKPRRAARATRRTTATGPRIALHDEIIAVLRDRGPSSAAELASAIAERGKYRPPRSAKPLDAATVNSRVSNPVYRSRFKRAGRKIELAG